MSAQRPTRKESGGGGGRREEAAALYVYCVGERDALAPLVEGSLPGAIESGSALELVGGGALAAVASAVPLADYGEEQLRARLADPTWTAARAMRHEGVVEHFARRASVVPLRFGTIYLRRESVEQMLGERGRQLRAIIERLRGREEWGLNLYADRAKLLEGVAGVSPLLREMSERAATASPGQGYLLRKKIDAARADEARAASKRVAAEVERALAGASDGAARLRTLKDEASEHGDVAAKFAFLVARAGFEEFRGAAERLARAHEPLGFRLELTGPWPAYNFAGGEGREGEGSSGAA